MRIFLFLLCMLFSSCVHANPLPPPQVVPYVDLERYQGLWYEIASYPQPFQKGCVGTRATYKLKSNDKVAVINQCQDRTLDGPLRTARGKAWVVDKTTNAKLKVSFFWPFAGDYWIIMLADDYSYAVVGHPEREYLWILSRTRHMSEGLYAGILQTLREVHQYDTDKLVLTLQP